MRDRLRQRLRVHWRQFENGYMSKVDETTSELYTRQAVLASLAAQAGQEAKETCALTSSKLTSGDKLTVVTIRDAEALRDYLPEWDDLVANALEPNVFYESWQLLPALRLLGKNHDLQIALVFVEEAQGKKLCGLFPLERQRLYNKLPVRVISLWRHKCCYLATPLLRSGYARETLAAFFDWLAHGEHGCPLLKLDWIAGEGKVHHALVNYLHETGVATLVTERFTRALFKPSADAETYLRAALSRFRLKEYRRQERRLIEAGRVEYRALAADGDVEAWIQEFLQFEAESWKGYAGRAIGSRENDRAYFETVACAAFKRGQLMMLALDFNGRPIAHKCNFLAQPGSFAFKIAFVEAFGKYSPGVLLELENIRRLHARPELDWMDSCASPDRFMINQLWPERRTIQSILVSTGSRGDLILATIPLMNWAQRRWRQLLPGQM
jgi:CelD/BcsL family acetyltransferase involved in cellulose biosynthesis